jgi:AcrR family transcriptional regulator
MSELRNTPIQQRSQKRLQSILDAGWEVLLEVGRDRLTSAMVAERAGMSIGTFYRYYEDRVALLEQLLTVTTLDDVLRLPAGSVLLCNVQEVFHLHDSPIGPTWLAAGYDNTWPPTQVVNWAPLTILHLPTRGAHA